VTPRGARAPEQRGKTVRQWSIACVLFLNTACSFIFVDTPPSDVTEEEATRTSPDCTSSQFWPAFDVTGVVASGLNVGLVSASSAYTDDQKKVLMSAHAVYGVLYAISAVYGFSETAKCKNLKDKFASEGAQWKPALKQGPPAQPPAATPSADVGEPATSRSAPADAP
jgi:hypothetical protein